MVSMCLWPFGTKPECHRFAAVLSGNLCGLAEVALRASLSVSANRLPPLPRLLPYDPAWIVPAVLPGRRNGASSPETLSPARAAGSHGARPPARSLSSPTESSAAHGRFRGGPPPA